SMESAMTSRETREYFMPSVPLEMPSDTVMVPKMMPLPLAASTLRLTSSASVLMCMLQGVTMLQVEAMPTWGLRKSASLKPTAWSIARPGTFATPSVTILEGRRRFSLLDLSWVSLLIALSRLHDRWKLAVNYTPGGLCWANENANFTRADTPGDGCDGGRITVGSGASTSGILGDIFFPGAFELP